MKKKLFRVVIVILMLAGLYSLNSCKQNRKKEDQTTTDSTPTATASATASATPSASYKDASYSINGQVVKLVNGIAETEAAPGSASMIVTKYFGNEIKPDFNNDGRPDVVFLITQNSGGSGVFYYVVAALNKENGYEGSRGLLIGDRIAPGTIEAGDNKNIVVKYTDRKTGEDFGVQPSVAKSIRLVLDTGSMQFGEVAKDFEGEADPSKMSPGMKNWEWISITYNDGKIIKSKKPQAFTLRINDDGTFSATTDCNRLSGKVVAKNKTIKFSEIISTKMFCEDSQEADFQKVLERAAGYFFTSKGELVLDMEYDSGSAIFK